MKPLHCVVICLLLLLVYYLTSPSYVAMREDGRHWKVLSDYDNSAEAAALLSRVHAKVMKLMRILRDKYHIDETDDEIADCIGHSAAINAPNDTHNIVKALIANYNPDVIYENDARGTSETSYTTNKGQAMYICLRRKDDPRYLVNEDELLFVMLHECSHIANYRGWGHERNFWETFMFVLHEAEIAGLYRPIDYAREPADYCGLKIEYNPLLDPTLRKLWVA